MAYICVATHESEVAGREGPTITLVERAWAYCRRGGFADHHWQHLAGDGLPLHELAAGRISPSPDSRRHSEVRHGK